MDVVAVVVVVEEEGEVVPVVVEVEVEVIVMEVNSTAVITVMMIPVIVMVMMHMIMGMGKHMVGMAVMVVEAMVGATTWVNTALNLQAMDQTGVEEDVDAEEALAAVDINLTRTFCY